ncbi:MAG: hypothetical protein M3P49_00115 [Actinomycetota bacterium]|nr:hypothetical protein [Actinomycetota bacterium]
MQEGNPPTEYPRAYLEAIGALCTVLIGLRDKEERVRPTIGEVVPEGPHVTTARGGTLSSVSIGKDRTRGRGIVPWAPRAQGNKKEITGFSDKSRRTLLRKIAEIDRDFLRELCLRVFFVTLTYPEAWPEDPEECKAHLRALLKRMERRFGPSCAGFWRLGIQTRGAWHFHLLVFLPHSRGLLPNLRRFLASNWCEVRGEVFGGHPKSGTRVDERRGYEAFTSAGRYLGKKEEFPEGLRTGRVWGTWRAGLLPVHPETAAVSRDDAFKIRRAYRRLSRRRGNNRAIRTTVFVRYENVVRLLESLGYRPEDR